MLELEKRILELFPLSRRSIFGSVNFSIIIPIGVSSVIVYMGAPKYIIAAPFIERIPCGSIEQVIINLNQLKIKAENK